MEGLRDCLEEMVKFTLDSRAELDLDLSDDFCSGLLAEDPGGSFSLAAADTAEEFAGVPEYPLYKRLALGLLRSIASGSFCRAHKKISLINEESWLKEKEEEWGRLIFQKGSELVNALKDMACELPVEEPLFSLIKDGQKTVDGRRFIADYDRLGRGSLVMLNKCLMLGVLEVHHYASFYEMLKDESLAKVFPEVKTVEEGMQMLRELYEAEQEKTGSVAAIHVSRTAAKPCIILANILSGLSYGGVQSLLGLSHTAGSILHAFPSPRSTLLSSFMLPYKPQVKGCPLSHGARALAKHVDRSSDRFWGVLHGSDSDKNRLAADVISHLLTRCCWMNVHIVQPHGEVFEIRVAEGYGARWSQDGCKFIGFLEPYMDDGHSKGWKH